MNEIPLIDDILFCSNESKSISSKTHDDTHDGFMGIQLHMSMKINNVQKQVNFSLKLSNWHIHKARH